MNIFIIILTVLGLVVLGAAINQFVFLRKQNESSGDFPVIPEKIPVISQKEREILEIYLKEWQVIIETQMHFNDLILRFRSITLTTFVTLIGAVVAISNLKVISKESIPPLFLLISFLWIASFIIDFRYYDRLLLGSVKQAMKYDNSKYFRMLGLFGMTSGISNQVKPLTSKWLLILYYAVPMVGLCLVYLLL